LIAEGHDAAEIWGYSPRQIAAFLFLAGKRHNRDARQLLALNTLAARGEPASVKKQIKDLED